MGWKDALFWHDTWISNSALKNIFLRLFLISSLPMASVDSIGYWENSEWRWNLPWSRSFRPHDQIEWDSMSTILLQVSIWKNEKDVLIWNLSNNGIFSVRSFYEKLFKNSTPFLGKIWNGLVPSRIEVFTWLTMMDRIHIYKKKISFIKHHSFLWGGLSLLQFVAWGYFSPNLVFSLCDGNLELVVASLEHLMDMA